MRELWKNLDSARAAIWGVLLGFAILGAAVIHGFERQDDTNETLERNRIANAQAACETGDELRAIIRDKLIEAPLEVGESLIDVLSSGRRPPNPERVAEFRRIEHDRLTRIANDIPERRWDADSAMCVDVVTETESNEGQEEFEG